MRKNMKKVIALLLSMVMALAMGMVTFAAGNTTLTINTTEGHTYKVYQLLKGDVSGLKDGSGTLANVERGSSVTKEGATADGIIADLKDKTGGTLGNAAYKYVEGGKAVSTVTGDGENQNITVEEGYYVVTDERTEGSDGTDSISRYLVAVVGPTTMEPKTETPEIDKKIIDTDKNKALDGDLKKTDTAAIGDTIEYEVTGNVPNYDGYTYYYYVLEDTLSKGLTLDENSFVVTVNGETLTKDTDYYVYVTKKEDGTTSFKLAFENIKNYTVGAEISVKYNATVNENAEIGTTPNTNTVKLIFSNNPNQSGRGDKEPGIPGSDVPTGDTPDRITKTYVTEIKVIKVDEKGNKLTGAEFTLTGSNLTKIKFTTGDSYVESTDGTFWKLKDGTYTTDDPNTEGMDKTKYEDVSKKYKKETIVTAETISGENKSVTAFVDADGYIQFTGLDAGKYTLTETVTPKGYNTIAPIEFTISATQTGATVIEGGNITWSGKFSDNKDITLNNNTFEITVTNRKGLVLPSTGGIGTVLIYLIGGISAIGATILLIAKKRRHSL